MSPDESLRALFEDRAVRRLTAANFFYKSTPAPPPPIRTGDLTCSISRVSRQRRVREFSIESRRAKLSSFVTFSSVLRFCRRQEPLALSVYLPFRAARLI